jgi:putative ABC transport system permease protein
LAVVAASALFVAGPTIIASHRDETNRLIEKKEKELVASWLEKDAQRAESLSKLQAEQDTDLALQDKKISRAMRDLGFNLRIMHKDTNLNNLYVDFKAEDMPEEYVQRLAASPELTKVRHLVATLRQKFTWNNRSGLLVGVLPSAVQLHLEQKPPMGYDIKLGTVFLGHSTAGEKYKVGDEVEVKGKKFTVGKVLPHSGKIEDVSLFMRLPDAQAVLKKPDTITEIMALGCKCKIEQLSEVREQLEKVLPETQVTEFRSKAIARKKARDLSAATHQKLVASFLQQTDAMKTDAEEYREEEVAKLQGHRTDIEAMMQTLVTVTTPLVVLICALWIGLQSWENVRQRRGEIGILRAIGKGSGSIAGLFLGKAVLIGLLGSVLGSTLGLILASALGNSPGEVAYEFAAWTLVGAPLVAAMAAYLPTLAAIQQDPAIVLQDS